MFTNNNCQLLGLVLCDNSIILGVFDIEVNTFVSKYPSKELKESLLGIPAAYIEEHGVVSYEVCQQMAIKGQKVLGVDVCVAFTGNAGPETNEEGGNVGEIYIAIVYKGQVWPIPLHLELGREENREYSVQAAINAILSII